MLDVLTGMAVALWIWPRWRRLPNPVRMHRQVSDRAGDFLSSREAPGASGSHDTFKLLTLLVFLGTGVAWDFLAAPKY